jgi:hypothetical protein
MTRFINQTGQVFPRSGIGAFPKMSAGGAGGGGINCTGGEQSKNPESRSLMVGSEWHAQSCQLPLGQQIYRRGWRADPIKIATMPMPEKFFCLPAAAGGSAGSSAFLCNIVTDAACSGRSVGAPNKGSPGISGPDPQAASGVGNLTKGTITQDQLPSVDSLLPYYDPVQLDMVRFCQIPMAVHSISSWDQVSRACCPTMTRFS